MSRKRNELGQNRYGKEGIMRSLKFRVWDKENEEYANGYEVLLKNDGSVISRYALVTFDTDMPVNVIIEQYTGLKDKNGKEIYSGDIVRKYSDGDIAPICGVVEFYKNGARFCVNPGHNLLTQRWEVIGNIHESNMEELSSKEREE